MRGGPATEESAPRRMWMQRGESSDVASLCFLWRLWTRTLVARGAASAAVLLSVPKISIFFNWSLSKLQFCVALSALESVLSCVSQSYLMNYVGRFSCVNNCATISPYPHKLARILRPAKWCSSASTVSCCTVHGRPQRVKHHIICSTRRTCPDRKLAPRADVPTSHSDQRNLSPKPLFIRLPL